MAHRRRTALRAAIVTALALAACGTAAASPPTPAPSTGHPPVTFTPHRACDAPAPGQVSCLAIVDGGIPTALAPHTGGRPDAGADTDALRPYSAADLQAAYRLPSDLLGGRQTIAIVDAFDNPNIEADLAVYRAANGLPACDANFPCFRKVDQRGGTDYPPGNVNWGVEEALDVDMASAVCPNCQILLVEADSATDADVAAAVDTAVKLGADVVSNSYGESEYAGVADLAPHYRHPGVVMVASSGDAGFGVSVPASLPGVIAVGGTTLYHDGSQRGWGETAWAGAGSGCSAYTAKPRWQHDGLCGMRTSTDVSAVADPNTPVAVYDTLGANGWIAVGGTSAAAPIVAGVYALAGNGDSIDPGAHLYGSTHEVNDVVEGANGNCGDSYLCTAGRGYDGPTGWGSPDGIGAF